MHIPDGYLSPETCGVMYVVATPFWATGVSRVGKLLRGRTVPLLAMFAAFEFAIMMFNVPVPGGTTAHGVGGTLVAIVLGPWAAVITTSVALIIQALFFGDGGITAIGANCFNMGIVLPFVGYGAYRLLSGRSEILSQRRIISAAIGSYIGITTAALCVGFELGIQPHLWSHHGVPDYSPYGFGTAIPAMLASHALGASFVEAALTALAVAYLQKSYPELLPGGRQVKEQLERAGRQLSPWIPAVAMAVVGAIAVFVAGLIKSGGDLGHWAGADWRSVDWSGVVAMVVISLVISAVVLPLLFIVLRERRGLRTVAMLLATLAIWVPIGLIAPGSAFAEDKPATQQEVSAALAARANGDSSLFNQLPDVNRQCSCVPNDIGDVQFSRHTPLKDYEPPWVNPDTDPLWQQSIGYQIAGLFGFALFGLVAFGCYRFARWLVPADMPDWRTA